MTRKGLAKGKTIELTEALPYPYGQWVNVSVEPTSGQRGSPACVLEALKESPHVTPDDVQELERIIREGELPVRDQDLFGAA